MMSMLATVDSTDEVPSALIEHMLETAPMSTDAGLRPAALR